MTIAAPQGYTWVWSQYGVDRAKEQGLPSRVLGLPASCGRDAKKTLVDKGILELRKSRECVRWYLQRPKNNKDGLHKVYTNACDVVSSKK